MNRISGCVITALVVLFAVVLITGCTSSSSVNNSTAQPTATSQTVSTGALYTAGDIVRSPKAGADTGYLILNYNPGTDSYERAFIYRNNDGSWGYRIDSSSVTLARSALEKVYSVKITHVDPSSVPLTRPVVTATPVPSATTSYGTGTTTSTPVATFTTGLQPRIKDITPDNGMAGTSISVTDLHGEAFQNGASVTLIRSGSPNISATSVNVLSSTQISCTLPLPSDAEVGVWDVVVSNPGAPSARYNNGFTVRAVAKTTVPTTTSLVGAITISSIDPTTAYSGEYKQITVVGTNFKDAIAAKLVRGGYTEIPATTIQRSSETQMTCFFAIPSGSSGTWDLVLTNTDGTTGTLTNGFSVSG
jgi:hypothetical protein